MLKGEDTSDLLYKSLDDYKKTVHRIVCVDANIERDDNDEKKVRVQVSSWQNNDISPLYQIEVCYSDNNWLVIVPWSSQTFYELFCNRESV